MKSEEDNITLRIGEEEEEGTLSDEIGKFREKTEIEIFEGSGEKIINEELIKEGESGG